MHWKISFIQIGSKKTEGDTILLFSPDNITPISSIQLGTKVYGMCWGRTYVSEKETKLCLFCLTEKREIIQIIEGDKVMTREEDRKPAVSGFVEVYAVDKVEQQANELKKKNEQYRMICESWVDYL